MQIDRAANMIFAQGKKRLGFFGISFKPGTDDLRESPLVRLIEMCLGKGYEIRIYDRSVSLARLVGANKAYIEKEIPHVSRLLSTDLAEVTAFADVIVVGHRIRRIRRRGSRGRGPESGDRPGARVRHAARGQLRRVQRE